MEEPKTAPETPKTTPESEKAVCKANDRHTFVIALLTSIIVVGLYHFGMGAYKIYFPHTEDDYLCEEITEEEVVAEPADEIRPKKERFKGKKPGSPDKPHKFDKDGKPRKPHKFDKDGKPRKFGKGKKPDAPKKADAPEKVDAPATAPAAEKAAADAAK